MRYPTRSTPVAALMTAAFLSQVVIADPIDFQKASQGENKDPQVAKSTLEAIKRSVKDEPGPSADQGAEWVRALSRGEHFVEAVEAASVLLTLPTIRPETKLDLLENQGWNLVRSGKPDQGVAALLAAVRQSPRSADRAAEWAARLSDNIYNDAIAAAQSGNAAWASNLLDLCVMGLTNSNLQDTPRLQALQRNRVKLLIASGPDRAAEALAQAKAYYNISSMRDTAGAMLLVVQALQGVDASGKAAELFKQEQIDGSAAERVLRPTQVASLKVPTETVLRGVKVNGSMYEPLLTQRRLERYDALTGRGNLLLLADRPGEAYKEFLTAYTLADNGQIEGASANLARAYKAQDRTIGRANAWVLSLRPKPPIIVELVSTAKSRPVNWKYTLAAPADGWQRETFDDSKWTMGLAPFGHQSDQAPIEVIRPRTSWTERDIYMRRTFTLPAGFDTLTPKLRLMVLHDEDAEIYINGVLATELKKYNTTYELFEVNDIAREALRVGVNTLAVHCHDSGFAQVIDVGLVTVEFRN